MPSFKTIILLSASSVLAACAIHPLPEDVTGYNTNDIVRKIRCEARDAIVGEAKIYLENHGYLIPDIATLRALTFKSRKDAAEIAVEQNIVRFSKTGIVYSFALTGTETNGISLAADIVNPIKYGTLTLSPSAGNTVERKNIRAFTVSDNFLSLVQDKKLDKFCEAGRSGPNFEYPIVGRIGIDEMVKTFVRLTLLEDLEGPQTDVATSGVKLTGQGSPTMVDTITFTTTISGGLTPKISLSPVGKAVQIMDASLTGTVMRVDAHEVIIGLAVPASVPDAKTGITSKFISHVPQSSTTGEIAAAAAVAQQINRFDVPRNGIVSGVLF
jgi:hypothetical protein